MTFKPLCHALALALFLLSAPFAIGAADAAEEVSGRPSAVPGVAKARALVKGGKFDEALAVLRPLAEAHPRRTDVLFLRGLAATQASQRPGIAEQDRKALLDEAIAALRKILIGRPGLVRVRLELARAFFFKREDGLARGHFERVLAGSRRRRWRPISGASSLRSGPGGAGRCISAARWRRAPTSAPPRTRTPSI